MIFDKVVKGLLTGGLVLLSFEPISQGRAQQQGGGAFPKASPPKPENKVKSNRAQNASISGSWQSVNGVIRFRTSGGSVNGTYPNGGRLSGTLRGRQLSGVWKERVARQKCAETKLGSRYWGRFSFTFNEATTRFSGKWGHCNGPLHTNWTGTRNDS